MTQEETNKLYRSDYSNRKTQNNLNKTFDESQASERRSTRRSMASNADDVDYGRMSILDTTKISKQQASNGKNSNKDIKKKLDDQSKGTGACCNTRCYIF